MKSLIKWPLTILNKLIVLLLDLNFPLKTNTFFRFSVKTNNNDSNKFKISNTQFEKSGIEVKGLNNVIDIKSSFVSHSVIKIDGNRNFLVLKSGVKLRSGNIVIRGDDCNIEIGEDTTFGGIRIVNAGNYTSIKIGSDCLFADQIELWASDTHNIFDAGNQIINREKNVFIGNKVWVGSRVIVLKGITIENGSIIGMGSVVVKDVPANSVSAGNPNRVIKNNVSWSL